MRIGILTFHRSHNYGAFLQAYALSNSLKKAIPEADVEIIDYDTRKSQNEYKFRVIKAGLIPGIPYYLKQYMMFTRQLNLLNLSKKSLITDDFEAFRRVFGTDYDLIVVGSDQVWVTNGMRGFPNTFWLPGKYDMPKVSYAASSRSQLSKMDTHSQELLSKYVNDFRYVGVRDEVSMLEINKFLKEPKTAHFNPDPVFTWDFGDIKNQGRKILQTKFGVKDGEKTIGMMVSKKETAKKILNWANQHQYKVIPLYRRYEGFKNVVLTPFEWMSVISAVNGMVSCYFHGLCFSIKYDTPFIAIEENKSIPQNSKMYDLLSRIGATNRYLSSSDKLEESIQNLIYENKVDFSKQRDELYNRFCDSVQEIIDSIAD